jgi:hypothetical protein
MGPSLHRKPMFAGYVEFMFPLLLNLPSVILTQASQSAVNLFCMLASYAVKLPCTGT